MPDEIVLVRHGETEWSLSGTAHEPHRSAAARRGPRARGRRVGERARAAGASRSCSAARCSALARPASWPASAIGPRSSTTCREWQYGEYEGLTTPEIREQRARLETCGATAARAASSPARSATRADRVLARARARRRRRDRVRPRPHPPRAGRPLDRGRGRVRGAARSCGRARSARSASSARRRSCHAGTHDICHGRFRPRATYAERPGNLRCRS